MSDLGRRLVSLTCLLAYLLASAPAGMSAAWDAWNCRCHTENGATKADAGSTFCCASEAEGSSARAAGERACRCVVHKRGSTLSARSSQSSPQQGDDRSYPGCPACPGECHLCSTGAIPFCFTPSIVMQPLGCLGRVSADTLLHLWQPHRDELIRPPMC